MAPLPGLAAVTIQSKYANGQAINNTFHISKDGLGSAPDFDMLTSLASDLSTYLGAGYAAILGAGDLLVDFRVSQVADPTDSAPIEAAVFPTNLAGTGTGSARTAPHSAAGVIQERTPNASRRFRGHMMIPGGWSGEFFAGDTWATSGNTWWTNAGALLELFEDGLAPTPTWTGTELADWFLVIYSKAAQVNGDPSVAQLLSLNLDTKVHWLRSREKGST